MSGPHPTPPSALRWHRQLVPCLLALLLWSAWPRPAFHALLLAYAAAWLLLHRLRPAPEQWLARIGAPRAALIAAIVALPPLVRLHEKLPELLREERLVGIGLWISDRVRLESPPAIAPPLVATDHPQTFYVHAPGARVVAVRFGAGVADVTATSLGEDLFRVAYDPRRHGPPRPPVTGELAIELVTDGERHARTLAAVLPLAHPRWFASAPGAGRAATVSEETDQLLVLERDGLRHAIEVGDGPTDCAFYAGGSRLAVSHRYGDRLWLVDAVSGSVVSRLSLPPFQVRLATSPDERLLAVAIAGTRPGVQLVALPEGRDLGFHPTQFEPDWIAFGEGADALFVSSLRTATLHRLARAADGAFVEADPPLALGRPAVVLARAPDGRRLHAATTDYWPRESAHRGNHFIQDQILTIDTRDFRVASSRLTHRRTGRQDRPGNVDRGASPLGILPLADGSLRVAFAGTDEIASYRAEASALPDAFVPASPPLPAPHGIGDLGDGHYAVASPSAGVVAIYGPDDRVAAAAQIAPGDAQLLRESPAALMRRVGEHAFFEATRSGISCQSCHPHVDTDFRRHNISALTHTRTIRGLAGTAPYLRGGGFPRVRDLLFDVAYRPYRGYLRDAVDRPGALEAYVYGLEYPVNPRSFEPRDLAVERAGVAAFVKAACVRCHAFPAFTNLGQHPMRALWPERGARYAPQLVLDTPSLRMVWRGGPFLHDSRAENLDAVLREHNPSNRHGNVAALDEAERGALIRFLVGL